MTYETPSAGSAVFVLPLPGPSFLPKRIMRIRITALQTHFACGVQRDTIFQLEYLRLSHGDALRDVNQI